MRMTPYLDKSQLGRGWNKEGIQASLISYQCLIVIFHQKGEFRMERFTVKTMFRLFIILLISTCVIGSTHCFASDIKSGFRDLKWGQPPPQGMVKVGDIVTGDEFERSSDKLLIGDIKLSKIRYYYNKSRLIGVKVFAAIEYSDKFKLICEEWWGKYIKIDPNTIAWNSKDTNAILNFGENDEVVLILISNKLAEKVSKEIANQSRKDM